MFTMQSGIRTHHSGWIVKVRRLRRSRRQDVGRLRHEVVFAVPVVGGVSAFDVVVGRRHVGRAVDRLRRSDRRRRRPDRQRAVLFVAATATYKLK